MLTDSKSPKSTYLPATIWVTVFAGIGEKLGPTTNGCWSSGPNGRLAAKELLLSGTGTEAPAVVDVLKIGQRGVAKVATKDGTVKLGLPCVAEGEDIACCSGKAPPEAKKVAVCCDKLDDGAVTPPEAACSSTLSEFPRKLLELEPGPFSAANEAFTASTIAAIRAGSWTPAATTGAETVEDVCGAEFAAEASDEGPDDSACKRVSDDEFSPSKRAAKLLLVRRVVIVQAENSKQAKPKHKLARKQQAIATTLCEELQASNCVYKSRGAPARGIGPPLV